MGEYGYFWFYLLLFAFLLQNAVLLHRRWPWGDRRRRVFANLSLLGLTVFGLFLAAEGILYLFWDTTDSAMALLTSRRWIDRHVRFNSLDYRGREIPFSTPWDGRTLRILALGDSVTFGHGISREEDRYPDLLEAALRRAGIPAQVYNASRMGWNSTGEKELLRMMANGGVRFDLVLLGYTFNDLENHLQGFDIRREHDAIKNIDGPLAPLLRRSLFLDLVRYAYLSARNRTLQGMDAVLAAAYADPGIWAAHTADLEEIASSLAAQGTGLAVVTFPFLMRPWPEYRFTAAHQALNRFWSERGVAHVDLLPVFVRHDVRELMVNRLDAHPNELAHRLAAEALTPLVLRHLGPLPR
jgi:lysophospholipase L1-like esterase